MKVYYIQMYKLKIKTKTNHFNQVHVLVQAFVCVCIENNSYKDMCFTGAITGSPDHNMSTFSLGVVTYNVHYFHVDIHDVYDVYKTGTS